MENIHNSREFAATTFREMFYMNVSDAAIAIYSLLFSLWCTSLVSFMTHQTYLSFLLLLRIAMRLSEIRTHKRETKCAAKVKPL